MTEQLAADSAIAFPVLSALVILPFLSALALIAVPKVRDDLYKYLAFGASLVVGALTAWVMFAFDTANADQLQFVDSVTWIESMGISWALGIDGISLWLVVLTGALFPMAIIAIDAEHTPKAYYAWLLTLQGGVMGVFMALDLFAFFVFFEIVLVPMYFLIGQWGHGARAYAATKFFIYTMFGSALMLVGILATAFMTASATGNPVTFDLVTLAETQALSVDAGRLIFLSFALAFAVKVPLFPVHTWLPDAHTNAPTAGSVILAGVMLKLGTYGFLRFGIYLFPEAAVHFAPFMVALGAIGILYGAIAATMQKDLKRLVAYSSVAHLGFIVLGTFALNTEGLEGGLLQMVNHGISTGALFLLVGWIYDRRHTREIAKLGGLQKPAPVFAGVFMVVMLSSIGLPGLNGFVGEFLALLGAFAAHPGWAVVAASGVILAALYLLWAYQRVFHGPAEGDNATMPDLTVKEGAVLAPFLIAIVFMGVYPKPVIERMEPAVDALIVHVETHVDGFSEAEPTLLARFTADEINEKFAHSDDYDDHAEDEYAEDDHSEADHSDEGGE